MTTAFRMLACAAMVSTGSMAAAREARRADPAPARTSAECAAMGPGFVKVEGTSTCVKLSGGVRAEFSTTGGGSPFLPNAR